MSKRAVKKTAGRPTNVEVYAIAAKAKADPRTVRRAFDEGIESIKGEVVRERIRQAMAAFGRH